MKTRSRRYEAEQRALNPHRAEERRNAMAETRDRLRSREPDDPRFVLPSRQSGETVRDYIGRIGEAAAALRRRPTD